MGNNIHQRRPAAHGRQPSPPALQNAIHQVDRVFDRYYESRGGSVAGLGLTIASAGVESLGGRIEVHSRVGRGTHFRITIPAAAGNTISGSPAYLPG